VFFWVTEQSGLLFSLYNPAQILFQMAQELNPFAKKPVINASLDTSNAAPADSNVTERRKPRPPTPSLTAQDDDDVMILKRLAISLDRVTQQLVDRSQEVTELRAELVKLKQSKEEDAKCIAELEAKVNHHQQQQQQQQQSPAPRNSSYGRPPPQQQHRPFFPIPPPAFPKDDAEVLESKTKNMVLLRLPEKDSEEETKTNDRAFVDSILAAASLPLEIVTDVFRHKDRKPGNPSYSRPVKVKTNSKDDRDKLMAAFLQQHDQLPTGTYFRPDLAENQLSLDRFLRRQVREMNNAHGQKSFVVKDLQIFPYYHRPTPSRPSNLPKN
jgi:hypothetical protein